MGIDYVIQYNAEIKAELASVFGVPHMWDVRPLEAVRHSYNNPNGCNAHLSSNDAGSLDVREFLQILFSALPRFAEYGNIVGFARAFLGAVAARGEMSVLVDITNYIFKSLALSPNDLPALLMDRTFRLCHELHYWANRHLYELRARDPNERRIPEGLDAALAELPADGAGDVVFVFLTANYLENLTYWLDLYRRHDPRGERLLVLAVGGGFAELLTDWLRARGAVASRVLHFDPGIPIESCGNGTGLNFIWYLKVHVAAALVQRGLRVVYSDLDAYWIKDYFAARERVNRAQGADIIVSLTHDMPRCSVYEQGFTPCAGFFSAEPTAGGKALMAEWREMTEVMFDDQIALAEILFRHGVSWQDTANEEVAAQAAFRAADGTAVRVAALDIGVARRAGLPDPATIGGATIWHPRWVMAPEQHQQAIELIAAAP